MPCQPWAQTSQLSTTAPAELSVQCPSVESLKQRHWAWDGHEPWHCTHSPCPLQGSVIEGAQEDSQNLPQYPLAHVQLPSPMFPSLHVPWPLQGLVTEGPHLYWQLGPYQPGLQSQAPFVGLHVPPTLQGAQVREQSTPKYFSVQKHLPHLSPWSVEFPAWHHPCPEQGSTPVVLVTSPGQSFSQLAPHLWGAEQTLYGAQLAASTRQVATFWSARYCEFQAERLLVHRRGLIVVSHSRVHVEPAQPVLHLRHEKYWSSSAQYPSVGLA
mmetsp:Transcript_33337/g.59700  ORF Transcript_33337/g.59700 Transcript_33337/m.59700 type:complete len:269 (-) Transcript_33337:3110-3916(-)